MAQIAVPLQTHPLNTERPTKDTSGGSLKPRRTKFKWRRPRKMALSKGKRRKSRRSHRF